MAHSFEEIVSDGVTTTYQLKFTSGYLNRSDVYVYNGDVDSDYTNGIPFTFIDDDNIEITAIPANGETFTIRRITPRDDLLVILNLVITRAVLIDKQTYQMLYLIQEIAADGFFNLDKPRRPDITYDALVPDELLSWDGTNIVSAGGSAADIEALIEAANAIFQELGVIFDDPIRLWEPGLLVSDLRAHRAPIDGEVIIPKVPLPFTTGVTFDSDNWVLYNGFSEPTVTRIAEEVVKTTTPTLTDLVFNSVAEMISGGSKITWSAGTIGTKTCTGGTNWEQVSFSNPMTYSDFKALNDVFLTDLGAAPDGSDSLSVINDSTSKYDLIYVPDGSFTVSGEPSNPEKLYGPGVLIGADVMMSPTAQVGGRQTQKSYKPRTYGRYESAAASSITANKDPLGQTKQNTSVNGTDAQGLSQRDGRDHVAQYVSINSFTPIVLDSSTTYTANSVSNPSVIASIDARVGMIIDTDHADRLTGIVESIDYSTNTLTVGAWYKQSDGLAGTPANGTGCIVNPNSKVFGQNIIVFADGDGGANGAKAASGIELSVITGSQPSAVPGTFGIDMAIIQDSYIDVGYQIRGKRNFSYWSNNAGGSGLFGFRSDGDNRGFYANDCNIPIEVVTGGQTKYTVDQNGGVTQSGTRTQNAVATVGSSLRTLTSGTDTITTIVAPQAGGRILISGVNSVTGVPYIEEGIFRTGVYVSIAKSDGSGLTPTLAMNGSTLEFTVAGGTMNYSFEVKKL